MPILEAVLGSPMQRPCSQTSGAKETLVPRRNVRRLRFQDRCVMVSQPHGLRVYLMMSEGFAGHDRLN